MDKKIVVSVLVATYNPDFMKLKQTIISILKQENVAYEIVVTDDGSRENYFDKLKCLLSDNQFTNFKLHSCGSNVGTVENICAGLEFCEGKFIKIISPGDFFSTRSTLCKWVTHMKEEGSEMSFGKAYYYSKNGTDVNLIKTLCHPQVTEIYKIRNQNTVKAYYLLANDIVNGATVMCRRNVFEKYIQLLLGKVVYAEDNAYRIMVADGIVPSFFDNNVIFYEFGSGISTQKNNKWSELLKKDWLATDDLIMPLFDIKFKRKFLIANELKKNANFHNKIKALFCISQRMKIRLSASKYTNTIIDDNSLLSEILTL